MDLALRLAISIVWNILSADLVSYISIVVFLIKLYDLSLTPYQNGLIINYRVPGHSEKLKDLNVIQLP